MCKHSYEREIKVRMDCISHLKKPQVLIWIICLGTLGLWMIFPPQSEAVPAFARKYDLSCTSCHTKPPRLNPFGEAFNMSGFNIPATTKGGEVKKKRKIGRVRLERSFLNIFAMRILGNFVEYVDNHDSPEANIVLPHEIELFLAGTLTNEISYFFEMQTEAPKLEGTEEGEFTEESSTELALGRSFLILNLNKLFTVGSGHNSPIRIGPMLRIGNLDPSTFFSFPFERQYFKGVPGRASHSGKAKRFTALTPYALASKFFGVKTGGGVPIEVTKQVLYNGEGFGVDLHALIGNFIVQAGLQQGIMADMRDDNLSKDPYLMGRYNFGWKEFMSGSASGFLNWGNNTAKVDDQFIDWFRYGAAFNIKLNFLDLYGVYIWDELKDLPRSTKGVFADTATGMTIEADYLILDKLMLMLRYDQLKAGGFLNEKVDGEVISFQARYYIRDNLGVYVIESHNLEGTSSNPLQSYRDLILLGIDFDW